MILYLEYDVSVCYSSPPHSWGLYSLDEYKKLPIEWEWYNQVPSGELTVEEYSQERNNLTNQLICKWDYKLKEKHFTDRGKVARLLEEFYSSDFSKELQEMLHKLVFELLDAGKLPEYTTATRRNCHIISFTKDECLDKVKQVLFDCITDEVDQSVVDINCGVADNNIQIGWHYPNKTYTDSDYRTCGEFYISSDLITKQTLLKL